MPKSLEGAGIHPVRGRVRLKLGLHVLYEQNLKDDGVGGVTKALHKPARSGDASPVRSAAAHDESRASRVNAIFQTLSCRHSALPIKRDTGP